MDEFDDLNLDKGAGVGLSLRDLIDVILHYWYWFILSVIVLVTGTFFYLKTIEPIYQRKATVFIKDNKGSNTGMDELMGLPTLGSSVENEIFVFKSKDLIRGVAKRLNLNVMYKQQGVFRDRDLYSDSPVSLTRMDDGKQKAISCQVTPLSQIGRASCRERVSSPV